MKNAKRSDSFKKVDDTEKILKVLDENLSGVEEDLTVDSDSSKFGPIFIFGCARSGTTVLHQYLIQNIKCTYPTNFLSRFYFAPYLGGIVYKLFTELDTKGELLGNKNTKLKYSSDLGKTQGIHSPNEFWYFWRKHFDINSKGTINYDNINEQNIKQFRASIIALQNLFSGPFVTKGMIANNCIQILEELFPNARFLYIKRDVLSNAYSLYKARIKYFNDPSEWYSFYPKNPEHYKGFNPYEQVVHQVLDTNNEIEESLNMCSPDQVISIEYKDFCLNPSIVLNKLKNLSKDIETSSKPEPDTFSNRNSKNRHDDILLELSKVINETV